MNLRPLLGDFTDPQHSLPREVRRDLHRRVKEKYIRPWHMTSFTISLLIVHMLVFKYTSPLLVELLRDTAIRFGWKISLLIPWLIAFAIYLVYVWFVSVLFIRFVYTRPVRRAMRDAGYILCIECGYDLQGHTAPEKEITRCPECGAKREAITPQAQPGPPT